MGGRSVGCDWLHSASFLFSPPFWFGHFCFVKLLLLAYVQVRAHVPSVWFPIRVRYFKIRYHTIAGKQLANGRRGKK